MPGAGEALDFLKSEIAKVEIPELLSFEEYLELAIAEPERIFRNIFQLFHDLVKSRVGKGEDEYPEDPESIGFVKYDCSRLFANKSDNPFFADRLFANRFIRQIESLQRGFQQNRIYTYMGPSGCGKTTFLNNLLNSFADYTRTKDGHVFEMLWEISERDFLPDSEEKSTLLVPCPSHDYPILVIPKTYRADFLAKLLSDNPAIKEKIFKDKPYEWILTGETCTICKSIFDLAFEKLGSVDRVLKMVRVRVFKFDRRLGEGISVFNPGDQAHWVLGDGKPLGEISTSPFLQEKLDKLFGVSRVKYVYSSLARTNNGIYVLMDVKGGNGDRLLDLHNVISEGVHKVGDIEEQVISLFFALMNPEDSAVIEENNMESFKGRIQENKILYVLEPSTEVNIYRSIFGGSIDKHFLPRILENFARVIVSSRMTVDCKPLKDWISDVTKYKKYCDENGLLLRMSIYMGIIPTWLSEEDRKKFEAPVRRAIVAHGEDEGNGGFSGRESIELFRDFFIRYSNRANLINMENVKDFFKNRIGKERRDEYIPKKFLDSLIGSYDYAVLNKMKEAMYFYNEEQISRDILNYLFAVNYDIGDKVQCPFTGEQIDVSQDFLKLMAARICGRDMSADDAGKFGKDSQKKYSVTAARGGNLLDSELYKEYFSAYVRNLKEKALVPFVNNPNFREAIKTFGTPAFETFDTRLKEQIVSMIGNLMSKFEYTEQGAKEICLYVIDKNLAEKFSQ